jgi:hypothetical protein
MGSSTTSIRLWVAMRVWGVGVFSFPFSLSGFEGMMAASDRRDIVCGAGGDLVAIYMIISMYICIIRYLNTYFV